MKALKIILLFVGFLFLSTSQAQLVETGLSENPAIKKEAVQMLKSGKTERNLLLTKPVILPFFDDFRQAGIFPDTSLWIDDEAFINYDYGRFSANRGVATLDMINSRGYIYDNASEFSFVADHLTSKPIRLDSVFEPVASALSPADSVYLSFFYQPQGRGDMPEENDSLILEFGIYGVDSIFAYVDSIPVPISSYINENDTIFPGDSLISPCNSSWVFAVFDTLFSSDEIMAPCDSIYEPDIVWKKMWSAPGMPLDSFYQEKGTFAQQVLIPVVDSVWFTSHFFFRFYNLASLSNIPSWKSNGDHWNLDYIYLNYGRSSSDSSYRDIGFVQGPPSMLMEYEMMPWDQYMQNPTNEIREDFRLYITNLDNTTYNTFYSYTLTDEEGSFEREYEGGQCSLQPTNDTTYQSCDECPQHACPPWRFLFPLDMSSETAVFEINHILMGDVTAADTLFDTMTYYQRFYNFYAYDDGTAEAGVGLQSPGDMLAYQFRLNRPDTIHGIQMFVNRTATLANDQYFTLAVWRDNNGQPGELVYSEPGWKPKFPTNLNQMQFYEFDEEVPVTNVFYVGWIQQSNYLLNVGFDKNNNAREKTFVYGAGSGNWEQSILEGAIMIRPVMGEEFITSTEENTLFKENTPVFYPNPVTGNIIHVRWSGSGDQSNLYLIYNVFGQEVQKGYFTDKIELPDLTGGIYIIRIINTDTGSSYSEKIILSK